MGLFKKAEKAGRSKENNKTVQPYESAPVISREGKIGRKEDAVIQNASVQPSETALQRTTEVTISDNTFMEDIRKTKKKKHHVHTVKSKEKMPFPVMTVVFCSICTLLFMSMIVNLVKINEYTKEVSDLQSQVTELDKKKGELSAELDRKNNAETLRKYLEEHKSEMGMVEEGMMNPPIAVTPEKEDKVEDFETEDQEKPVISVLLNAVAKNLADTWNIFAGNE